MIQVRPEADYDCVYVELADETSRVRIHFHSMPGTIITHRELRQLEVVSTSSTVLAQDRVSREARLPCDPHGGIGGQDDYEGNGSELDSGQEHDEDGQVEGEGTDVHDG